jgi:hydroxymethylpyrimidine pyrophosphatase-like HAD family hydrolase
MGNALPEVKAVAWRVAPSNNEEGVARVLAELFGI